MKIKLENDAFMPTKAYESDAGYDLYSREKKVIYPSICNSNATFDTGVHLQIPEGYYGKIESRSGLNVKNSVVSCGGVIDSHYTGSIKVKLYNFGVEPYIVHPGDRIAQIIIQPFANVNLEQVDDLEDSDRGNSGFGSSGK